VFYFSSLDYVMCRVAGAAKHLNVKGISHLGKSSVAVDNIFKMYSAAGMFTNYPVVNTLP